MKQHNIKPLGTFIHIAYFTAPLFGLVAQIFSAATLYRVYQNGILIYFKWLSLPVFLIILFVFALISLFISYKFLYRSYFDFQNSQQFPEDGQLAQMIRKIVREELDRDN